MRSIRLLAATSVIVTLASACGDGGSDIGNPPVANFTAPSCTADAACQFTDASTPVGGITSWSWNFGDLTALDPNQNPVHTFAEPGTYTVTLTVTNSDGSHSEANPVTVIATPTNTPPVASFTAPTGCTVNAPCRFTSTSTDPDVGGTITLTRWDFGGGVVLDGVEVEHTYTAAGTFNVILTVTDNLGGIGTITQAVTVSPPASLACTPTDANEIDCALNITQATAQVKVTLTGLGCELVGNRVFVPPPQPAAQDIFSNVCNFGQVGDEKILVDDAGAPLTLAAGSQLHVRFKRGTGTPPPGAPAANVVGTFPNWTISIDDGGNLGGPGEPDFTDVVLTVQATP